MLLNQIHWYLIFVSPDYLTEIADLSQGTAFQSFSPSACHVVSLFPSPQNGMNSLFPFSPLLLKPPHQKLKLTQLLMFSYFFPKVSSIVLFAETLSVPVFCHFSLSLPPFSLSALPLLFSLSPPLFPSIALSPFALSQYLPPSLTPSLSPYWQRLPFSSLIPPFSLLSQSFSLSAILYRGISTYFGIH